MRATGRWIRSSLRPRARLVKFPLIRCFCTHIVQSGLSSIEAKSISKLRPMKSKRTGNISCGIFLALALGLSTGCYTTDIAPAGRDTYMIVVRGGFDTAEIVRAKAYARANAWCEKRGLVMVPILDQARDVNVGRSPGTATLYFRAVPPTDGENVRPRLERAPDTTIEVRER